MGPAVHPLSGISVVLGFQWNLISRLDFFFFISQVTVYLSFGGQDMAAKNRGKHPGHCSPIFPIQAKRRRPRDYLLFLLKKLLSEDLYI